MGGQSPEAMVIACWHSRVDRQTLFGVVGSWAAMSALVPLLQALARLSSGERGAQFGEKVKVVHPIVLGTGGAGRQGEVGPVVGEDGSTS